MIKKFMDGYFKCVVESLNEVCHEKVKKVSDILHDAYQHKRYVFIMGNGGSASTASHFACDLGKTTITDGKPRFRVISLNDNVPLMTALSNDFGYDKVFIEQLINLVNPGDIVICITGSGNSPNVLEAIRYAKGCGAVTISNRNYGQIEDVHLILCHAITQYFKEKIANSE